MLSSHTSHRIADDRHRIAYLAITFFRIASL
jgi:hypothetical protein